jgi:apolipoprotein N-acyltransferase
MKKYSQILLAISSGVLVCFSFPTVLFGWHAPELGIIGWIALVPLFLAIREATARKAFVLTFISAIIWYGASLYWVFRAMHTYGKLPAVTSILVTVLLVVFVSAYIALAPMFARWTTKRFRGEMLIWLPVFWVSVEFCRNYIPCNGFPWSNIAMSQSKILPAIQIADIVGVYGLIFAMVWFNQYLVELILWIRKEGTKYIAAKTAATVLLIAVIIGYGIVKLQTIPKSFKSAPNISIGMIQGNIDQGDKWDPVKAGDNLNIYRQDARKLRDAAVDLIVWPEASYPAPVSTQISSMRPQILGMTEMEMTRQPYTLMGAVSEEPSGNYHNSAFLFDAHGRLEGHYHKAHLVPFGEYIPYKKIFFFAKKLTAPVGNFIAGETYDPLVFDGHKMGILICYEDVFPEISRKSVFAGAEFLANITNDAWYGVSSAPYQHLALSVFRAVENRRFMIRSTNSGVSAVIDPWGRITMESNIFERSMMVAAIAPLKDLSPYTKLGDWFAWGCIAYSIFGLIMSLLPFVRGGRVG